MPASLRMTGSFEINLEPIAGPVGAAAVAQVKERLTAGLDVNGAAMPEYSPLYRAQLEAIGESTSPTMRRSGGLINDVKVLRVERSASGLRIIVGVGDGTSVEQPRPPPWVFSQKQTEQERVSALARWRASSKKSRRSIPHTEMLASLTEGRGRQHPHDNILGLTAAGMRALVVIIERGPILKG